jgi:hypothetical protein
VQKKFITVITCVDIAAVVDCQLHHRAHQTAAAGAGTAAAPPPAGPDPAGSAAAVECTAGTERTVAQGTRRPAACPAQSARSILLQSTNDSNVAHISMGLFGAVRTLAG